MALKDTIDGSEQPQRPHNSVALNSTITGSKNCEYSFAPEKSNATGSTGHNDIARVQLGEAGDVVDQGWDVEVQVSDGSVLADFAVHTGFEGEFIDITDDVGWNQVRAETTRL